MNHKRATFSVLTKAVIALIVLVVVLVIWQSQAGPVKAFFSDQLECEGGRGGTCQDAGPACPVVGSSKISGVKGCEKPKVCCIPPIEE